MNARAVVLILVRAESIPSYGVVATPLARMRSRLTRAKIIDAKTASTPGSLLRGTFNPISMLIDCIVGDIHGGTKNR